MGLELLGVDDAFQRQRFKLTSGRLDIDIGKLIVAKVFQNLASRIRPGNQPRSRG